jgi:hypothetical protein
LKRSHQRLQRMDGVDLGARPRSGGVPRQCRA